MAVVLVNKDVKDPRKFSLPHAANLVNVDKEWKPKTEKDRKALEKYAAEQRSDKGNSLRAEEQG